MIENNNVGDEAWWTRGSGLAGAAIAYINSYTKPA